MNHYLFLTGGVFVIFLFYFFFFLSDKQDAQSRTVIGLWKVNLEEPKSHLSDPSVIIHDISTKTRIRLASANENDKQQFQWFSNACKGIPQARPAFLGNNNPAIAEDIGLAVALSASLHSASQERPRSGSSGTSTNASNMNGWNTSTNTGNYNGWDATIAAASPKVRSSDWSGVQNWPSWWLNWTCKHPGNLSYPNNSYL